MGFGDSQGIGEDCLRRLWIPDWMDICGMPRTDELRRSRYELSELEHVVVLLGLRDMLPGTSRRNLQIKEVISVFSTILL